jgi:chemotaxis protein MotA
VEGFPGVAKFPFRPFCPLGRSQAHGGSAFRFSWVAEKKLCFRDEGSGVRKEHCRYRVVRMVVIVGCVVVLVAVLVGFTMAGGHVGALLHLSEFVTIGGASFGALIIMSPKKVLVDLVRSTIQVIKGTPYGKKTYIELFELLYAIARTVRRDGLLALESHLSDPGESSLFQNSPRIYRNHHALEFLVNGLSLITDGKTEAAELTAALDEEIKVMEREHHGAVSVLAKTADALPGFGIVAAVLGIVVTMQAIDGPASEIGHKVAAALVGTFLGILMSYGFFAPMAGRMEFLGEAETTFFRAVSSAIVSMGTGASPREMITQVRRILPTDCRPGHAEMARIVKEGGG